MKQHIPVYANISFNMKDHMTNIPKTAVPFAVYSIFYLNYQWDIAYLRIGGLAGGKDAGRPAGGGRPPEIPC